MRSKTTHEDLEQRLKKLGDELSRSRRAEEDARYAVKGLRTVLDSLVEHVVYQDTEMGVVWANHAACESVAMAREDLIGRHCYELWAGRQTTCEDCPVAKARDTGEPHAVEKMSPDGRWWYVKGYPIQDDRGRVLGMTEVSLDITDRKRAQEALRESYETLERRVEERTADLLAITKRLGNEVEERRRTQQALQDSKQMLSNVFKAIGDLVAVIDKDLRVVTSNWKGHEYVSEQERKSYPYCYACFMGRPIPCEPCYALEVFRTGKMKQFEHVNPINGKIRNVRVLPLFDDEGNVAMVVEHLHDVTERRRAEGAVRDSEKKLRAILAASPVGIGLVRDRIIKWGNSALYNMLAYEEGALEGMNTKLIYANRDEYDRIGRELYPAVAAEGIGYVETKWVAKDGTCLDCYVQMTALDQGDPSKGVIIAAMDITQRKQAEDRIRVLSHELLQAQEVERQRLAYDLHDHLAQDLSAIKIRFDTFCDHHQEISTGARQRMSVLSGELEGVISAVRNLAYELRPPGLDEAGVVDTLEEYCQEYGSENNLEIDFFPVGVVESELSRDTKITLYRLVQEALSNVSKHADANRVVIRLVPSFPNIILRIEDDGKGFDVAVRLAATHNEKRLGLLGMKERVALLGGTMKIHSRMGQGTKILVELPCQGKHYDQ